MIVRLHVHLLFFRYLILDLPKLGTYEYFIMTNPFYDLKEVIEVGRLLWSRKI